MATSTPTPTSTATPTSAETATPTQTATPTATATTAPDLIFADGFESGDFSEWSSYTDDSGDLSISTAAALQGTYGLQADVDDNNSIYVTDDSPDAETHYRARFYFDPNSITMAENDRHFILTAYSGASTINVRLNFKYISSSYQLSALVRTDTTETGTGFYTLSDAPHAIEIEWQAASYDGANDGFLSLWIDGVVQQTLSGIDNDTWQIDTISMGAVNGVDTGTRGTYYFDTFESRRSSYIGLAMNGLPAVASAPEESVQIAWMYIPSRPAPHALRGRSYRNAKVLASPNQVALTAPANGHIWRYYYYAGTTRLAMRKVTATENKLYYMLGDHLGSTSKMLDGITTTVAQELRYKPWGEVRYASPTDPGDWPTDYTYTGQKSEMADLGLMFYNARWLDPSLGRFTSPDSIIPGAGNPLAWDRFAYALNNPVKLTDPSGHHYCEQNNAFSEDCRDITFDMIYGISLEGFTQEEMDTIRSAVKLVGESLSPFSNHNLTPGATFIASFGNMVFKSDSNLGSWYGKTSHELIRLKPGIITERLTLHELSHAFEKHLYSIAGRYSGTNNPVQMLIDDGVYADDGSFVTGYRNGAYDRHGGNLAPDNGYYSDNYLDEWQWHPRGMIDGNSASEDWADIFLNWVTGSFVPNKSGDSLMNWVDVNMVQWVP